MIDKYDAVAIESKWQKKWEETKIYKVDENSSKPKWYALTMFPYTSGDLHVGHWFAMAPSDAYARFKRMQGYNVLHPVGFDSFGLPAENAAIKRNIHPRDWTLSNVENMTKQLKSMGPMYDWDRVVVTCLPEYYKWTEWLFLKLYEAGLAYRAKAPVNWCPQCQAVLANEQVEQGKCWRCGTVTTHRDLEQWFFRITKYADELMVHNGIDWPERIKTMQTNWVGRSEGVEVSFEIERKDLEEKEIVVYTTRPDTIFGVSFLVLAPENPLVEKLTTPEHKAEIDAYIEKTRKQTEIDRLSTEKVQDGAFTGSYVINRLTGEKVPVWVADYVLNSYGTGAVMGVAAHDERDWAFATRYNLPIRTVITYDGYDPAVKQSECHPEPGKLINSGKFNGMESTSAITAIAKYIEEQGWGKRTVRYKLRDWLISRQRYWGAPIPMIYCEKCGIVPVPEKDLPVLLPDNIEFKPTGESPLKYCEEFINTTCPKCGGPGKREIDTMDTFMCSSWYFLRYCDPHNSKEAFSKEQLKKWMPVDIYTGGAEHAVMHLFYSRFFIKALRDMGIVDYDEPFTRLFNQGTVTKDHDKMSKSRGNVVNPDDYVNTIGADTVRTYLMFLGPWEQGGDWDDSGIYGLSRWLGRIWNVALTPYEEKAVSKDAEADYLRLVNKSIAKVTGDIDKLRFNTAIATLMEYTNAITKIRDAGTVSKSIFDTSLRDLLLMTAPLAPHITEELWSRLGYGYSIHQQDWPTYDAELAKDDEIPLIIQVNGKIRDKILVEPNISEDDAILAAEKSDKVNTFLAGKEIIKKIYVPGKLLNIVVK
ncbi:MAG: leucine--tRNA ligase [Dehalococcoidales bacterium]|nr:leucine--tRNA ligase [Dehalococcoidales bacterium]